VLLSFACSGVVVFFSSRRRHTRSDRDWSSDVCSSDLQGLASDAIAAEVPILGVVDACIRVFRRNGFHFQQYP